MNALTKALVVVVTILSVALVALVVPFAARTPDYAQQYNDLKSKLNAQVASASAAAAEARNQLAAKGADLELAQKQVTDLSEQLGLSETANAENIAKLASAEATGARATAAMEVSARTIESKNTQIAKQGEQIQKGIADLGELQAQIADLTRTVLSLRADSRRLSDNYERIQEENKALTQQLSEAKAEIDNVTKKYLALGGDVDKLKDGNIGPVPTIRGSVVKIDQVSDGLTFVQLNVGSRDQVKEGMEFTVYRGDSFVGKVQVASVDTAECVGRLTLGGGIQEGDAVRAGGR